MNLAQRSYVAVAGIVMMAVGAFIALTPTAYFVSMQYSTPSLAPASVNLLSDLRGMGGVLLAASVFLIISAFRSAWLYAATIVSTAVYSVFFLFRGVGIAVDGVPDTLVLVAHSIEFALALIGLMILRQRSATITLKENVA